MKIFIFAENPIQNVKRRDFIKGISAAACAVSLLPATSSLMTGCAHPVVSDKRNTNEWDFDEIIDRSGTWSIKYGRASEGQIPMWIADMDFRTAPAVSSALKERLNRDVLGYTLTPE